MLGKLNTSNREVTVVGAGVAGLVIATVLDQKGYQVTLLERESRVGGLIQTVQTPFGMSEAAAHSFLATGPVREFCNSIGVELASVNKESKARYILRNGKLRRFPLSVFETIILFLHAYFVLADRKLDPKLMTLDAWAKRFLGKAGCEFLITPFVRGIYGARPSELAVGAAFPSLAVPHGHSLLSYGLSKLRRKIFSKKESPRKIPKDMPRKMPREMPREMVTPLYGMQDLIYRMEENLKHRLGERFRKETAVETLNNYANLVLAVPAYEAGKLLEGSDPALASALKAVTYTPLICLTAFAPENAFLKPVRGVGVLIPERENRKCLGILFNSSSFRGRVSETSCSSFTIMIRAESGQLVQSDDSLREIVETELREILGMRGKLSRLVIHRHERAIPRYDSKLMEVWNLAAQASWCLEPGHVLFGNYTGQVSLRGMIESALEIP